MNEKQGVYWHQGMFLQPQHFQQADINHQAQRTAILGAWQPHFWGVGELTLNKAGIANRFVEVESVQLILSQKKLHHSNRFYR